jgi:hypothetical protein
MTNDLSTFYRDSRFFAPAIIEVNILVIVCAYILKIEKNQIVYVTPFMT